MKYIM